MRLDVLYKWKVAIRITSRVRSSTGFIVTGPDGKTQRVPTKAEALALIKARMACHTLPAWTIRVAKTTEVDLINHLGYVQPKGTDE